MGSATSVSQFSARCRFFIQASLAGRLIEKVQKLIKAAGMPSRPETANFFSGIGSLERPAWAR